MAQLEGKRILVTGGAGFIGSHLSKKLSTLTPSLTIYDNLSNGNLENVKHLPKVHFVKGDILDTKKLVSQERTELIYHLAAQVVVPYSMENPVEDFETNARGTLNVLEKARKDDARVVFSSSAAVYGNPAVLPTPEDYGFHPVSCYGLSKVVGEEYCQMYTQQYGLKTTILRFANVYGPGCHGVISDFLDKIHRNPGKLEIIGTGLQSRDFVHVSDVVDILLSVTTADNAIGGTFNVGFGKTTKIIDLAKMMLRILNLSDKTFITTTNVPWKGDINTIWFDITKAKNELKWTPMISIEDNLKEIIRERKMTNDDIAR
jgi:UDP-glucose 4-epimerase